MHGEMAQNTSYRFDEYNRTIVLDGGHSYDIMVMTLLQNDKSFAIGEKYIEIGRVTYAVAI